MIVRRKKRGIFLPACILVGVCCLGVKTLIEFVSKSDYTSLRQQVLGFETMTHGSLEKALDAVQNLNEAVQLYGEQVKKMQANMHKILRKLKEKQAKREMTTSMGDVGRRTAAVLRTFRLGGRVSDQFFSVFKDLVVCENCPLEMWQPLGCDLNMKMRTLILTFRVQHAQPTIKVLQARPFSLAFRHNDAHGVPSWCFVKYNGPRYALFDESNRCAAELNWKPMKNDEPLIGSHEGVDCAANLTTPRAKQWHLDHCSPLHTVDATTVVQTLATAHNIFVYCTDFNLTYMGITLPCVHKTFRLRIDQSWSAGSVHWTFTNRSVSRTLQLDADMTEIVNEHLSPDLHHHEIIDLAGSLVKKNVGLIKAAKTPVPNMDMVDEAKNFASSWTFWLLILALASFSCAGTMMCYKGGKSAVRWLRGRK